jgi:crossover junction endodeoxyribonuclease RuvC
VRILGLDPGSFHTGYGVLEGRGGRFAALAVGRISTPRGAALPARLAQLSREARDLLSRWQPDLVVVESPFRGINSRSLIVLAEARGALLAAAALHGATIREFTPAEVKAAVTGNGRAAKDQVARMVRLLLALDSEPLASDASDALAVAICCAQRLAMDALKSAAVRPPRSRK